MFIQNVHKCIVRIFTKQTRCDEVNLRIIYSLSAMKEHFSKLCHLSTRLIEVLLSTLLILYLGLFLVYTFRSNICLFCQQSISKPIPHSFILMKLYANTPTTSHPLLRVYYGKRNNVHRLYICENSCNGKNQISKYTHNVFGVKSYLIC